MAEFSELKTLELWYRSLTAAELIPGLPPGLRKRAVKRSQKEHAKSRSEEMFPKLVWIGRMSADFRSASPTRPPSSFR